MAETTASNLRLQKTGTTSNGFYTQIVFFLSDGRPAQGVLNVHFQPVSSGMFLQAPSTAEVERLSLIHI